MSALSLAWTGIKTFFGGSGISATTWLAIALVAILALGAVGWRCYAWGYGVAEAKGRANYAELDAAQARANELVAQRALKLIERQMDAGNEISAQLAEARKTIAAQGREIRRRIEDALRDVAAVDGRCSYGPGWVRWLNDTLGVGQPPGGQRDAPGGAADGQDAQAGAAVSGVLWAPAP